MTADSDELSVSRNGPTPVDSPPFRWTDVCPFCGYSLNGLPDLGICPECGEKYDTSKIILYGLALGSHANISNSAKSRLPWLIFVTISPMWWCWISAPPSLRPILLIGVILCIGFLLVRRNEQKPNGPVQVHLSDLGAVQYDNVEPSYAFILAGSYFLMASILAPLAVIVPYWFGKISSTEFWVWGVVSVGWAVKVGFAIPKLRRDLANLEHSGSRNLNVYLAKPYPWRKLQPVELLSVCGDLFALRLDRPRIWWRMDYTPVHAKVRCTKEQAAWLRVQMRKWLADAQASEK